MLLRFVFPWQVNTHHHMFQCLTRCVAQDSYLFGWLSTCYSAWEQMKVSHEQLLYDCS